MEGDPRMEHLEPKSLQGESLHKGSSAICSRLDIEHVSGLDVSVDDPARVYVALYEQDPS